MKFAEIGAVKVRDGRIIDRFQTLLNPQRAIPANIQRLTGISPAMVEGAPYFIDIADDCRVPAGQALAIDRELFASRVSEAIESEPLITLERSEATSLEGDLPTIVAGGGAAGVRGGRHIRSDAVTPLANLHLSLLAKAGVHLEQFADSTGHLTL